MWGWGWSGEHSFCARPLVRGEGQLLPTLPSEHEASCECQVVERSRATGFHEPKRSPLAPQDLWQGWGSGTTYLIS